MLHTRSLLSWALFEAEMEETRSETQAEQRRDGDVALSNTSNRRGKWRESRGKMTIEGDDK